MIELQNVQPTRITCRIIHVGQLMRARGLGGGPEYEQETSVEESSVKALDSPPLAKASQNGSRKDSTEGQTSSGHSCAGSTGGAPSSKDDVTSTDGAGPESKTALRLPGAAESPTSPVSSDLLEAEAGRSKSHSLRSYVRECPIPLKFCPVLPNTTTHFGSKHEAFARVAKLTFSLATSD